MMPFEICGFVVNNNSIIGARDQIFFNIVYRLFDNDHVHD